MRLLLLIVLAWPSLAQDFTQQLWEAVQPIYGETIRHPFLKGLTQGDLPGSRFQFYLEQDARYLGSFSRALSILASKAPKEEWAILLNRHAVETLEVERQLHQSLLDSGTGAVASAPTNLAYSNHLLVNVSQRPFGEGLAAMLPCYWIYWEVGKELKKRGSKRPEYQRWIDQYAGEDYGATVRQVLEVMNEEAAGMSPASRRNALRLFETSARYEYMFWDMAWREEQWPP